MGFTEVINSKQMIEIMLIMGITGIFYAIYHIILDLILSIKKKRE